MGVGESRTEEDKEGEIEASGVVREVELKKQGVEVDRWKCGKRGKDKKD